MTQTRTCRAHHYAGYDNPLTVRWLCQQCHTNEHRSLAVRAALQQADKVTG